MGPRNCIGQNFAQIEGVAVLAKLFQRFDIKLDPNQSFHMEQVVVLRPKEGTKVFLTLRE
jgi:cytochrome P450